MVIAEFVVTGGKYSVIIRVVVANGQISPGADDCPINDFLCIAIFKVWRKCHVNLS